MVQVAQQQQVFTGLIGAQQVLSLLGKGYSFSQVRPQIVLDRDSEDVVYQWSCEIEGAFQVLSSMATDSHIHAQGDCQNVLDEVRKFGDWLAF